MDAGARASEPCLGRFPPLWTCAVPDTAHEISPMAEPRRAAATAPRFEGGRFLIVKARYYDAIGADLLAGAIRAIEAAGAAYDLISVAGALEIPAGMAIALDAAKAAGRPYDGAVALGCVVRGLAGALPDGDRRQGPQ